MRSKSIVIGTLAAALLSITPVSAQPVGPSPGKSDPNQPGAKGQEPTTLEEMLAHALKYNPDIQVAEVKVRLAEAELNQVRQQVLAKIVAVKAEIDAAEAVYREAEARLERLEKIRATSPTAVPLEEFNAAVLTRDKYKFELIQRKAKLPALLGKKGVAGGGTPKSLAFSDDGKHLYTIDGDGSVRIWDPTTGKEIVPPAHWKAGTGDNLRKALDTPVKLKVDKIPLRQVLKDLEALAKVNIVWFGLTEDLDRPLLMGLANEVPLGAMLQLVEDLYGVHFYLRDYGLIATQGDLPMKGGGMRLSTFWKHDGDKK
jgi:hypothetical protein